jgi:hypothetical protein
LTKSSPWLGELPGTPIWRASTRPPACIGHRYHAAELVYIAEVEPRSVADAVIDNRDFDNPRVLAADDLTPDA